MPNFVVNMNPSRDMNTKEANVTRFPQPGSFLQCANTDESIPTLDSIIMQRGNNKNGSFKRYYLTRVSREASRRMQVTKIAKMVQVTFQKAMAKSC